MKKLLTAIALPLAILALSGCMYPQHGRELPPPGHYENRSDSEDASGTSRSQRTSTDVYYDKYGNKKADIDRTTTTDPKGLFNKKTTTTHNTSE